MSLELNITSINDADENVRQFIEEKEGKFYLNSKNIDPAKELKIALDKEKVVSKGFKAKAKELEAAQTEAEKTVLKNKQEFETLFKNTQKELDDERKSISEYKAKITVKDIDASALEIASTLSSDIKKIKLIKRQTKDFITTSADGEIVYEIGGIASTKEAVIDQLRSDLSFIVDGNQSTGGGANGGKNSGGAANTVTQTEFNNMSSEQKSKFSVSGGTVTE